MPTGIYKRSQKQLDELRSRVFKKGQKFTATHIANLKKKEFTDTHRKNLSISALGRKHPYMTGSKSNFWKDGRCNDKNYVSWLKNKRNRLIKNGMIGVIHTVNGRF